MSNNFEHKSLSQLCTLLNGLAFKPEDWSEHGHPIIRIQNLNGSSDFNFCNRPVPNQYMIPPDTVLFSWSGNRGTSFGPYWWKGPSGVLSQHIFKVSPKPDIYPRWLYYSLDLARQEAEQQAHGGSGLVHVRRTDLLKYKIPTPLPPEQRRIAEILDTIDEAIQKTEALISKLKVMKQGLLHDLLTRGLDENGKLRDPKAHPEQFKDSQVGMIPRRWDVRPLGVTATLQRGFDLPIQDRRPGDVPVFGSNGIDGWHNSSRVIGPGIITGRSGSIGFVYYTDTRFWPLNTTLYVKDFHGNRPKFVRLLLEYLRLDRFAAATGVPSLNRNFVHPIEVTVPEPPEQGRIVDVVETHDARIRTEEQYRDKLKLQKKGLMHDLLTGKVRVKV